MISVTILTRNSRKYLRAVLDSVKEFQEVLIYDTGSTDDTLLIAKEYPNVRVEIGIFEGFGITHNKASESAKGEWILSIDSDEIVSEAMAKKIETLKLDPRSVYSFPRHNYFNGKRIRGCGWSPDYQMRLYNRTETRFTDADVHEAVIAEGLRVVEIDAPIIHYSYDTVSDFLSKMQSYSTLFARQYVGKRSSSPLKAAAHGFFAFFKSYIIKRGFLDGYEGFLISAYNGHTAFYKYMKLYEANKRSKKCCTEGKVIDV